MPASQYKHVYKRGEGERPWWAWVHKEYLGAYATEEQAAEAVACKLQEPLESLLRRPKGKAGPKRTHRYVYWESIRGAWQVKIGKKFLGRFPTHEEALPGPSRRQA